MPAFCEKYLDSNYKAFQYRIRVGRCNPNEIIFISWFLGETVEDLFGKPFTDLMMGQGEEKVSEKAIQLFQRAPEAEQKRLLGLLGGEFGLGVPLQAIAAGVSTDRGGLELDGVALPVVLPGELDHLPTVDIHKRHQEVTAKAQKKAPISPTTVEDMAPKKKRDPFEDFEDFQIIR